MAIEYTVHTYLASVITDVPIYIETPLQKPSHFIRIERTGGTHDRYLKRASIAIQAYAETLEDAITLIERVNDAMLDIITVDTVTKCDVTNVYPFNETNVKRYRYQSVCELYYY